MMLKPTLAAASLCVTASHLEHLYAAVSRKTRTFMAEGMYNTNHYQLALLWISIALSHKNPGAIHPFE